MRKILWIVFFVLFLILFFILMRDVKDFFTAAEPNAPLLRNIMVEMTATVGCGSICILTARREE